MPATLTARLPPVYQERPERGERGGRAFLSHAGKLLLRRLFSERSGEAFIRWLSLGSDALPTELRPRPKKGTAPSLQQGIAKKRLQADDLIVRTLLDLHRADGQTMAEYSIILAVITPAIVLTISLLSDRIAGLFTALPSLIP